MPENRMLSNTMKGSKLRCMFYCIYKYYIYIIDWLMKYVCEWKQMLPYTHHHCLTHSQMIGWQLISSVTSDIIMSILPMQNRPRMSMFFNFLIVFFFLSEMSNLLRQLQNRPRMSMFLFFNCFFFNQK